MTASVRPRPRVPTVAIVRERVFVVCANPPAEQEHIRSNKGRNKHSSPQEEQVDSFGGVFEVIRGMLVGEVEECEDVNDDA